MVKQYLKANLFKKKSGFCKGLFSLLYHFLFFSVSSCFFYFNIFNICFSGPEHFVEFLNLVKDQNLYTEALKLYSAGSTEYKVCNRMVLYITKYSLLLWVSGLCLGLPTILFLNSFDTGVKEDRIERNISSAIDYISFQCVLTWKYTDEDVFSFFYPVTFSINVLVQRQYNTENIEARAPVY